MWQKLEEENREFFKAYYVRLMLMNQIVAFNKLLEKQYQIMSKDHPSGVSSMPHAAPNGSNSSACKFLFFSSYTSALTASGYNNFFKLLYHYDFLFLRHKCNDTMVISIKHLLFIF